MAAALAEIDPSCRVRFVGTRRGLEARVVPERGYPIDYISIGGLLGKGPADKLKFPMMTAVSIAQSLGHLRRDRPDVVLGTGGYVCAPPVLAAWMMGIPTALLALDAMPSKAVRLLSRFADQIYAGFPECAEHISQGEKVAFTGNPVRPEIAHIRREDGIREFGLDAEKKTILVFGGSQGAHSINMAMVEALRLMAERGAAGNIQVIHQTGKGDYDPVRESIERYRLPAKPMAYIERMPQALAASDLVVSRAGSSVSETLARGLPSILVPYPHAASNHQEHNARSLERAGAAEVILDSRLDGRVLADRIESILGDKERCDKMMRAARSLARPNAAGEIAKRLLELAP